MNFNRRGFLGAILAAGVAPVIVKASSIMKVPVRRPMRMMESFYFSPEVAEMAGGWEMQSPWGRMVIYDALGMPLVSMNVPEILPARDGVIDVPIEQATIQRGGQASFFKIIDSSGGERMSGDIGTHGDYTGHALRIDNKTMMLGSAMNISFFQLTEGNGSSGLRYDEALRNRRLDAVFS